MGAVVGPPTKGESNPVRDGLKEVEVEEHRGFPFSSGCFHSFCDLTPGPLACSVPNTSQYNDTHPAPLKDRVSSFPAIWEDSPVGERRLCPRGPGSAVIWPVFLTPSA